MAIRSPFWETASSECERGYGLPRHLSALARNDILVNRLKNNLPYHHTIPIIAQFSRFYSIFFKSLALYSVGCT